MLNIPRGKIAVQCDPELRPVAEKLVGNSLCRQWAGCMYVIVDSVEQGDAVKKQLEGARAPKPVQR